MSRQSQSFGYIDRVAAWFGIGSLDFKTTRTDRRRLFFASGLPLLILVSDAILFYLQAFQDTPIPGASSSMVLGSGFPETDSWERIYLFINGVQTPLLLVAVALLFIFGISSVPRSQASWALAIAIVFICLTVLFGLLSAVPRALNDGNSLRDWYVQVWQTTSFDLGFLAIGYAFLAYRGLSRTRLPSPRRVRIPPSQPPEL